jgi:hypothetical protein
MEGLRASWDALPTRKVEEAGKHYRGSEPNYVTHVFVPLGSVIFCRQYKLTLLDQARVTLQLTVFPT